MADFLIENPEGGNVEDILVKLYKTLSVMFSNLDSKNIKSIETEKTKIASKNGYCEIDGAHLIMRDKNGKERLKMGSNEKGEFVFILKNCAGGESLSLSSDGNAVFSGDIKTGNDAEIGNTLYIGKNDEEKGEKLIQFYDGQGNDLKMSKIKAIKDENGDVNIRIVSGKIILSTLDGVYDAFGNSFITTSFHPYVEINGEKYEVKFS